MLVDTLDSVFGLVPTLKRVEQGVKTELLEGELFESNGSLRFGVPSNQWPHREAHHISLRAMKLRPGIKNPFYGTVTENADSNIYIHFPNIKNWVEEFAKRRDGRVERVFIAALAPHKQIYRHADRGYYFAPRDRYHLVLKSEGSWMRIAGQEATLKEGEVWWINNKAAHESFNDSDHVRIHLIVDLYPNSVVRRVVNYLRWIYLGLRPKRLTNYWFNWPKRHMATS